MELCPSIIRFSILYSLMYSLHFGCCPFLPSSSDQICCIRDVGIQLHFVWWRQSQSTRFRWDMHTTSLDLQLGWRDGCCHCSIPQPSSSSPNSRKPLQKGKAWAWTNSLPNKSFWRDYILLDVLLAISAADLFLLLYSSYISPRETKNQKY